MKKDIAPGKKHRERPAPTQSVETHSAAALRDYLAGNPRGFQEFVRLTEPTVRKRVVGFLEGRADPDDVVQTVFIGAHKHAPKFRWASRVSTWLYRIAKRSATKARAGIQYVATVTMGIVDTGDAPDEQAAGREMARYLMAKMTRLSPKEREAVEAKVRGETLTEAQRVHLHNARAKLRREEI